MDESHSARRNRRVGAQRTGAGGTSGGAAAEAMENGKRAAPKEPSASDETRHVESSALLAALLESDSGARKTISMRGRRVTSALTLAEAYRAVIRARTTGRLSIPLERSAIRVFRRSHVAARSWLFRKRC